MKVVFLYGPPAAGKLTVAKELAKVTDYKLLDNHIAIDALVSVFPFTEPTASKPRERVYRSLVLNIFIELAAQNKSCITTFGNPSTSSFHFFRKLKDELLVHDTELLFVQLIPDRQTLMARVENVSRNRKINTKADLDSWLNKKPEVYKKFPDVSHLSIDNSQLSVGETVDQIRRYYKI